MEIAVKKLNKIIKLAGSAGVLFASSAYATCPPIVPCKVTAVASTIAGSNADQELIQFTQDITTSTNEVAAALIDMANANAGALNQSAQSLISANVELSQIQLSQELKIKKSMSDRKMAFDKQMTETAYRSTVAVVSPDDTPEEFQLILDTLGENSDLSVPEIVLLLKETMDKDDENGKVLVQIESSKGVCNSNDVEEDGKCAIAKRIYPGEKLKTLFQQCSADKRILVEKAKRNEARVAANEVVSEKTSKALETTDSAGAVSARLNKQRNLSCTPSQFKSGFCAGMSPEEYQEAIIIGQVIPNGDVSASNFNSPAASSAQGYITDLSDEAKKEIEQQSLDREPLKEDPNQRAIPFKHTYRNANQVQAAMHFIDNVVADDLIPAISPQDRRKVSNAQYQSRYLSRIAALSMVRLSLTSSMTERVGDKMREMMKSGSFDGPGFEITADGKGNKESVLGASPADILEDRVAQQASNLQLGSQNGRSPNAGNDFISNPSKADSLEKINDSVLLQNEMLMKEILINEQLIVMDSIALSQKANSKDMIELMEDLRRGRK